MGRSEADKCITRVLPYMKGCGIDIGFGGYKIDHTDIIYYDRYDFGFNDVGDAEQLPYENEQFDFVFSSHCLEHLDSTIDVLKEWFRILKKEGTMILYLPMEGVYADYRRHGEHKLNLNPDKIKKFMEEAGIKYTIIKEEVYNSVPEGYVFTCNGETEKSENFEYSFEMVIKKDE